MEQIPPLAWIAIIAIIFIFVVINLDCGDPARPQPVRSIARRLNTRRPSQTAQTVQRVKEVLRDPFKEERSQLNELSSLVAGLKEPDEQQSAQTASEPTDSPQ